MALASPWGWVSGQCPQQREEQGNSREKTLPRVSLESTGRAACPCRVSRLRSEFFVLCSERTPLHSRCTRYTRYLLLQRPCDVSEGGLGS